MIVNREIESFQEHEEEASYNSLGTNDIKIKKK
jgi:hypothetical protein